MELSEKIHDNYTNDSLDDVRKITDSAVDVGIFCGSTYGLTALGTLIGTATPVPFVGTAIGYGVGVTLDALIEYTPVDEWLKDGVYWVVDSVSGWFS